jgi:hypothetical protein
MRYIVPIILDFGFLVNIYYNGYYYGHNVVLVDLHPCLEDDVLCLHP